MKIYADKDSPRANGEAGIPTCPATSSRRWVSILYSGSCPPRGGDTLFASMYVGL